MVSVQPIQHVNGTSKSRPAPSIRGGEIPTLLSVDPHADGHKQQGIHTRWHPDIPIHPRPQPLTAGCIGTIELGQTFKVECIDYSGGQVTNDDCADDVLDLDHDSDHHLSGPFHVPGAEPGDVLEVDILDVQPFDSQPWGYCVTSPGLGSLDEEDRPPRVTKTIWDFHGVETRSRHVPHVHFHGRPHPGVVGTAPSAEMLATWNEREGLLAAEQIRQSGSTPLCLPKAKGAYVGQNMDDALREKIYREGARTSPGREHGGNIDIASLTRGSKMYLPVYVPGAKLSVGDLHFSEGDGEPTTAIEMSGIITLRVNVIRGGVQALSMRAPMYQTSPSEPTYPRRLVFTGLSTLDHGRIQTDCGGIAAYRNAALSAVDYLEKLGFSREQAYVLLSVAPVETKVVATANRPNFVISLGLPLDIFDFDITPKGLPSVPHSIAGPAMLSETRLLREAQTNSHGAISVNGANGTN